MNSNFENNNKAIEKGVTNIYLVMKQINASVTIDEKLKRRTRNGGFVAWPQNRDHQNIHDRNNA